MKDSNTLLAQLSIVKIFFTLDTQYFYKSYTNFEKQNHLQSNNIQVSMADNSALYRKLCSEILNLMNPLLATIYTTMLVNVLFPMQQT